MQYHFQLGNGALTQTVVVQTVAFAFGETKETSFCGEGSAGSSVETEPFLYLFRDTIVRPPADIEVLISEHGGLSVIIKFDECVLGLSLLLKQLWIPRGVSFPTSDLLNFVVQQLCSHLFHKGPAAILIDHITKINDNAGYLNFITCRKEREDGERTAILLHPLPLYLFDYSSVMQGSPPGNILRNSYGYQIVDPPPLRSPTAKPYPFPQHYSTLNHQESNIKQLENKLEGLAVKKGTHQEVYYQSQSQLRETAQGRFKVTHPFGQEEPLTQQLLRGSCQNIMRKFDYTALRNTTHFNPLNKPPTAPNELRRSPPQEDLHRNQNPNVNRTLAQQPSNTFLRPNEKKLLENKHSFLANNTSKSPPQITPERYPEDKTLAGSRTPTKYKTLLDALDAKNASTKGNPQIEDKKLFKTLNEIVQSKQKEKTSPQTKNSACRKSEMINGFELGSVLGRGKFGEVFLGRHADTGFIAAIKKIEKAKVKEFKMVEQFVQEIRLHSCLDHPNIVKFYGVFEEAESIYLVMELLNGGTLFDYLNEVNCLPIREAVEYLRDVIEALAYMHDKSIAHRDIKPENIVISSEGVAKLCDFGWSALVETSRKTYCGTFDYAPPEILERKNYDTSIDLWCIGVLTYELLTGRVPFEGDKRNVVRDKIVNVDKHKIDYPPDFPQEAKEFIEALVQKDPALRPKCHELLKFKLFTMHLGKGPKPKKTL